MKMSENGEIYTAGIKIKLPPAVTAVTNLTSGSRFQFQSIFFPCVTVIVKYNFFLVVVSQLEGKPSKTT